MQWRATAILLLILSGCNETPPEQTGAEARSDTVPTRSVRQSGARGSGEIADGPSALLGERYALLVAVHNYGENSGLNDLNYTEADIEDLADTLQSSGYRPENIMVMTQSRAATDTRRLPLREFVEKELDAILRDRSAHDTVLLAFAGHGVQFRDDPASYFCPADARVHDRDTLLSLSDIYSRLETSRAGMNLLLCDACRNDPLSSSARRATADLDSLTRPQKLKPPGGVAAFFSCSAGETAFEHASLGHGVFFHFVIEGLGGAADLDSDRIIQLPELEAFTKKRVADFVRSRFDAARQMPHLINNTRGVVALARLESEAPPDPGPPPPLADVKQPPEGNKPPDTSDPAGKSPPTSDVPGNPRPVDDSLAVFDFTSGPRTAEVAGAAQQASAKQLGLDVVETNSIGMSLVVIPPGRFLMGAPAEDAFSDEEERPQSPVTLTRPIQVSRTEVTQGQWQAVMKSAPWQGRKDVKIAESCPAMLITWDDAQEFCRRLSEAEKSEYRLLTEAEWEYACRAGTDTRYYFGDEGRDMDEYAWSRRNSKYAGGGSGQEVGQKLPNAFGLHDMHGNVSEWCGDWYSPDTYTTTPRTDPRGPADGSQRVTRGGSWVAIPGRHRSSYRSAIAPDAAFNFLGFRVARIPSTPETPPTPSKK